MDSCAVGSIVTVQSTACIGSRFLLAGTCVAATLRYGDDGVTSPWSSSIIGNADVLTIVGTTTSIITAENRNGLGSVVFRSTDNGPNFAAVDNLVSYDGALLYTGTKFLSASFSAPDCLFRTSTDGAAGTWVQSSAACSLTSPRLITAASSGNTNVVGGTHNGDTTPFLIRSTDGGATWQMDSVSAPGVTTITKIIAL